LTGYGSESAGIDPDDEAAGRYLGYYCCVKQNGEWQSYNEIFEKVNFDTPDIEKEMFRVLHKYVEEKGLNFGAEIDAKPPVQQELYKQAVAEDTFGNQKQPELKNGDFIDYNNRRWHVDFVDGDKTIKLTNLNPLDSHKEICATDWKRHIKEYTAVDKSEVDMSSLKPTVKKTSLLKRVEDGKQKARESDNSKDKPVKSKNPHKGVDD